MFEFYRKLRRPIVGFTLIELMIVVAIISLMLSLAIPAFSRYIKRSKSSEAVGNIRKIYDGQMAYFDIDHVDRAGNRISTQFVSAGPSPTTLPTVSPLHGNWSTPGWVELKFSMDGPCRYQYSSIAAGTGIGSSFTARANGDLDGDGNTSLFERIATVDAVSGNVVGGAGVYFEDELE
jgi:prepilin-type N-terminal cleavage/methylation domain-containing protein